MKKSLESQQEWHLWTKVYNGAGFLKKLINNFEMASLHTIAKEQIILMFYQIMVDNFFIKRGGEQNRNYLTIVVA